MLLYINAHITQLHFAFPRTDSIRFDSIRFDSQRLKQRAQRVQPPTASSSRPRPRHRHQPKRRSLRLRSLPRPSSSWLPRNAPDRRRHPAHAHRERIIHVSHRPAAVPSSSSVPIEFIQRERLIRARRNFPFVIARRRRRHAKSRRRRRSRGCARRESIRIDVTVRGPSALDDAMPLRRRRRRELFRVVRNSCDLHLRSNAFFARRVASRRARGGRPSTECAAHHRFFGWERLKKRGKTM